MAPAELQEMEGTNIVVDLPDVKLIVYGSGYFTVLVLVPVAEVINNLFTTKEEASFGIGPAIIEISNPREVHKDEDTLNGENPLLVKVTLELGLKIPMLYSITATITIIRIAQP